MKKHLLLIFFVVILSGCAMTTTKSSKPGTAEIVMREGQKWVHVLDTGVEFPLLGAWKGAIVETMRDKSGLEFTAIAVIYGEASEHSRAVVFVYPPKATTESFANMVYSGDYSEQEKGEAVCGKAGLPLKTANLISPSVFCAYCRGNNYEYAYHFVESSDAEEVLILYVGMGFAHVGAYPALQEMMRQVEIH
ncbi:MAG: lipoprotein [Proteobacteria bacterium]|nr:lipoprotein [Pseudomonadota bacterium]